MQPLPFASRAALAAVLLPWVAVGCVAHGGATTAVKPAQAPQEARSLDTKVELQVKLDYLLALPEGYADPARARERWPLVIFLHGAGESGNDLERVKLHGPPRQVENGRRFPFILASPQCPQFGWDPLAVLALLDHLIATQRVDEERVYLTGLSMGGNGTWNTATRAPGRFAAIVPICGWGDYFGVRALKELPTWAFHGQVDPIVPVARSEELIRQIEAAGGHPRLTLFPDLGHDCWTRAYDDPALWEWLLAQRRSAPEKE